MDNTSAMRGRFAPSPTGDLHLGNIWTALLAWLQARQAGGAFVVRVEDLDPDRSRAALARRQLEDLRWIGLDWDEGPDVGGAYGPYTQSQRHEHYARAIEHLAALGLVYGCYCTRAEARAAASAPHGGDHHAGYPGTCRHLSSAERAAREARGRRPCYRIRLPDQPTLIRFDDLCAGTLVEDISRDVGDFVLRRADGAFAYQLAVVVDDGLMSITHVLRGADLLSSTARQIWLHTLLGHAMPRFAHVPLLVGGDGHRLSKRHADLSVAALRSAGIKPSQIVGVLAHKGGLVARAEPVHPTELVGMLDLNRLSAAEIVLDAAHMLMPAAAR